MNALEAFAVSGMALLSGRSASSIKVPTLSIFELNRVFRVAREREIDFEGVSLKMLQEIFTAAEVKVAWDLLCAAVADLRQRLHAATESVASSAPENKAEEVSEAPDPKTAQQHDSSTGDDPSSNSANSGAKSTSPTQQLPVSVTDVLLYFAFVCPWNTVDQIASLVVTTGRAANGVNALPATFVARMLTIAGVAPSDVREFVKSESDDATVTDYDTLLEKFHEYEVFQEHTITHAKLKREATKRFASVAEFPRNSNAVETLAKLTHHLYDDDVVQCLLKLRPSLPRKAVSSFLADDSPPRRKLLHEYVNCVDISSCVEPTTSAAAVCDLLRIFFGAEHLQLFARSDTAVAHVVICVSRRIHRIVYADADASHSVSQLATTALVFALLVLNEDLRSGSVPTPEKWGESEFVSMVRPLWLRDSPRVEQFAMSAFAALQSKPMNSVFGDESHKISGWASKKALLAGFRAFLEHIDEQPSAPTAVASEVLGNLQSSEDGKRVRKACDAAVAATLASVKGEIQHSTHDLEVLRKLYQRLSTFVGDVDDTDSTSTAQSHLASLSGKVIAIERDAKVAASQAVANRLVYYDIDRLATGVEKLESLVAWLDEYSTDLLSRAQQSAARTKPPVVGS